MFQLFKLGSLNPDTINFGARRAFVVGTIVSL